MEPSYSIRRDPADTSRPRRIWTRHAAMVAMVAVVVVLVASGEGRALAAPPEASVLGVPRLPADPQVELAELENRAAQLSEQYRGHLVELEDAKESAEQASERYERVTRERDEARERLARLAASQYMSPGLDPALAPLLTANPDAVLDKAVTAEHLARSTRDRLVALEALAHLQEEARKAAQQQVDDVRDEVEALEDKRHKVQRLIDKFRPQPTIVGGDNITPRMRHVRDLVIQRFGAPYSVGCYRAGSWGEHPKGRACDFMLSSGGAMPSSAQVQRGWTIANWAKRNASQLGIMYLIYRQQIWDIRRGGGWRPMSDRGGVTANHYDHVHISVF